MTEIPSMVRVDRVQLATLVRLAHQFHERYVESTVIEQLDVDVAFVTNDPRFTFGFCACGWGLTGDNTADGLPELEPWGTEDNHGRHVTAMVRNAMMGILR